MLLPEQALRRKLLIKAMRWILIKNPMRRLMLLMSMKSIRAQKRRTTMVRKVRRDPTGLTLRVGREEEATEEAEETEGEAIEVETEREEAVERQEAATEEAEEVSQEKTSTKMDSRP
jgi:hypothetical protein